MWEGLNFSEATPLRCFVKSAETIDSGRVARDFSREKWEKSAQATEKTRVIIWKRRFVSEGRGVRRWEGQILLGNHLQA